MADPLAIKLVVAPPGDTDPPSSPISSTDDIIGINPPLTVVKDMPTPYDYGAAGDGATDDTSSMQAWLNAIAGNAGYGASGTFLLTGTVTVASGTTIWGAGRATFIVKRAPSFDPTRQMIINSAPSATPGVYTNSDIVFNGCAFDGGNVTTASELVSMLGVQNLTFRDCTFAHCRFIALAMTSCRNVVIDGCEFFDWGPLVLTAGGAPALWVSETIEDMTITHNYFHDGEWAGILLLCKRSIVSGNRFLSCKEAAIVGAPQASVIAGNVIEHVTRKYSTAYGLDLNGSDLVINGNYIADTESESIHLINVVGATISNNICRLAGQDTVFYAQRAAIGLLSAAPSVGFGTEMKNVTISGNVLSNEAGNAQRGIDVQLLGASPLSPFAGPPMSDMMICNNNMSAFPWPEGDITIGDGVLGNRFCRKDNNDTLDRAPVVFSLTIVPGDVLVPVVCGFTPSWIELKATLASITGSFGSIGQSAPAMSNTGALSDNGNSSIAWANGGANGASSASDQFCINIIDATGAALCTAHVDSFDGNGFKLGIDSCTTPTQVLATCHR